MSFSTPKLLKAFQKLKPRLYRANTNTRASDPFDLEGFDLIGQAQTGTGKTAAFVLPWSVSSQC